MEGIEGREITEVCARSEIADEQVTAPPRLARFVRRVSRLQPGKYVLTLTVREDAAFWTIQEMGRVEG